MITIKRFFASSWGIFLIAVFAVICLFIAVTQNAGAATTVVSKPAVKKVARPSAYTLTARWGASVKREAQFVYGINASSPMFLGQIYQESGGNEKVTAWDGGMGLGQFMPATAKQIYAIYPELGPVDPYNPTWSIRALVRFDGWIEKKMQGANECERWGAALKGYNAGPGWPMKEQKASKTPTIWFTSTEYIEFKGQDPKNFEYSRIYPRIILFHHQPLFKEYGTVTCDIVNPPAGKITFN